MQKWWSILFAVVNLAALLLFVAAPICGWWMPHDASARGYEVDFLFYGILWVTAFFFVLVEALLVWAMWRYAAPYPGRAWYVHGNHRLEWFWTIVPAVILLIIAFAQIKAWAHMKYANEFPVPDQIMEVSARQFEWRIRYPDLKSETALIDAFHHNNSKPAQDWNDHGYVDDVHVVNEVHTWSGAKVRVYLKTRDVIHSFFLPNMRVKQDALPGKTIPVLVESHEGDHNVEWDEAAGKWKVLETWELACAELCGWGHYKMQGRLFVHKDKADYDRWLKQAAAEQDRHELPQ
ncbi:MAG TPA: cytochrome c oxidase subunit II [Gemmataceae bacterium]|nr:cytochrome c oxidase subunit II [Gemmataceae bacterium]